MFIYVKNILQIRTNKTESTAAAIEKSGHPNPVHVHRDLRGGSLRAAVFGISDGLVSNLSLVLGAAGAYPAHGVVRLAGIIGLLGGSFSMGAGELISMQIQKEGFERELAVEKRELELNPKYETEELKALYRKRGLSPELAEQLSEAIMADPQLALDTHAKEELGIDADSLGSPWQAAIASFFSFALGAIIPLIPFLTGNASQTDVLISVALAVVAALSVGFILGKITDKGAVFSAFRQLLVCAITGAVTYGIGTLLKGSLG